MKQGNWLTRFALLTVCLQMYCSCRPKILHNKQEIISYIKDAHNGLTKNKQVGSMDITLTYCPWQLFLAKKTPNPALVNGLKEKKYFVLGLSSNQKELLRQLPYAQYSEMIQVLSFRMRAYISLILDNGRTVDPMTCLFQQTYGMSGSNELLLVFDRRELESSGHLTISVKEFGLNTGNLNFEMDTNDIKNIPTIDQ